MIFFGVSLNNASSNPDWISTLIKNKMNVEIGMYGESLNTLDFEWHKKFASLLHSNQLKIALHLPFFDLQPGSIEPLVLEATLQKMYSIKPYVDLYQPKHLVGHAHFDQRFYKNRTETWIQNAAQTWCKISQHLGPIPLYIENTFEDNPKILLELLERIRKCTSAIGFCFDVGHWNAFADGRNKQNLPEWIETLKNHICHLHLHDNSGEDDHHWPLGKGNIDFQLLESLISQYHIKPSRTYEMHSVEDMLSTYQMISHL